MSFVSLLFIHVLIFRFAFTTYYHGCHCRNSFMQEKFCESEFVFSVHVNNYYTHVKDNAILYDVVVENIYKWDISSRVKTSVLKAKFCSNQDSCCPVKLYKGLRYVVSGFLNHGILTLDACRSIITKTGHVSNIQMSGLSTEYAKNCDCVNKCRITKNTECYDKCSYCQLTKSVSKLVDMTYSLGSKSLFLPGVGFPVNHTVDFKGFIDLGGGKVWLERYNIYMAEHIGTHADAPSHMRHSPGGLKLDEIPIKQFFGDAVVIDISSRALKDPDTVLETQDILDYEHQYGKIKDGSIVFVHTGWQKFYNDAKAFVFGDESDPDQWHYPAFGEEASQWLVKNRNVNGVGIDSISLDPGISKTLGAHTALLEAGLFGIEMVKNLALIPPSGAKVIALPMKIEGGSGGPIRIVAQFQEKECHWKSSHCHN